MYSLIRPILFCLEPETAHHIALDGMKALERTPLRGLVAQSLPDAPRQVMGIDFPNPVGLAAGLDKNGDYIDAMAALGFGFLEIGTITPRPQPGNSKPRLFRLPHAQAIINRMGFNNEGVDYLIERVREARYRGVLGINIGKNLDTPVEKATDDYVTCLRKVYEYSSYVTVNISSPNTKGLRALQHGDALEDLLATVKREQGELAKRHGRYVPVVLKIAPDLDEEQIAAIADALVRHGYDGVIATNTTLSRVGVGHLPHGKEQGGLSGRPVFRLSTEVVQQLSRELNGRLPIIGVGGILSGKDAKAKIDAGASLVQIYSGFIYRGPGLIKEAVAALA
ncbi:MAG: quinone-dependent dihydroorotate dehydrogenase [Gammaproteobacteria bacterium]|nr:quinone-dependent dihydroorotate dehydrogenase [Gammaproteobacteria bacterium]